MYNGCGIKQKGFTIVELLIVIVVIGILAAITIVAFNGVQNRANDTAIQNDIKGLAKTIRAHEALHGSLPVFGTEMSPTPNSFAFPAITFKPTKTAYFQGENNLFVCKPQVAGTSEFAIAAKSKSGKVIAWRSSGGFVNYTAGWPNSGTICPALGADPFYFSYGKQTSETNWSADWIQ